MSAEWVVERLHMKKMMFIAVAAGIVSLGVQSARAGDREWATVGKLLTGVAAGVIIAKSMENAPVNATVTYGYSSPAYSVSYTATTAPACPPPAAVVCPPPPIVVQQPVVYVPAPVVVRQPVYCAPSPLYTVTYNPPHRGYAYGHQKRHGQGKW